MRKLLILASVSLLTFGSAASVYFYHRHQAAAADQPPGLSVTQEIKTPELAGTMRPDFSLPDLYGQLRHIDEWDGQVVALNFWATWCPPCLQEIPEFISLQEKYSGQGLQFIGVALQSADEVRDFVQAHEINYPVLVGELDVIELANSYGNSMATLPYTVIIDRHKRINFIKNGRLDGTLAEEIITNLL